jgi:response regulator RpfG family c-di-GMP phosphodiesterase
MYQLGDCAEKTEKTSGASIDDDTGSLADGKTRPKQILVVDDERPIRVLLQRILEANGYDCRAAENAAEARSLMSAKASDLILCDINMPGESGLDFIRHVLKAYPDTAAIIHDLGKISIPAEILSKPSRLTVNEFNLIKEHPQVGYDILKDIEFPWEIATMVYQHHEKIDGSGYPLGVSGSEILPESRVLTVADVVEAMASHRPYRPGLGIEIALEEIEKNRGKLYDPEVVAACHALFNEGRFSFEK